MLKRRLEVVPPKPLPDSPWEFIAQCCFTYDEHAVAKGLDPKRRFPSKRYLVVLVALWWANKLVRIEKSRQVMVTWVLAALWLWLVLKFRGQRVAWICKKKEDAEDHLKSRAWFIYENIPPEYAKPEAEFIGGDILVYHDKGGVLVTSRIESMAEGADQLRSFTYSGVMWDEAPFQEKQEQVHGGMKPTIDGGGRCSIVGSANGENYVWALGHANLDTLQEVKIGHDQAAPGIETWTLNGLFNIRLHYSADEDKNPDTPAGKAWYEAVRPGYSKRSWDREMEIDFAVPAGRPVYGETEKIREDEDLGYSPKLPLIVWWDFGWGCHTAGLGQVAEVEAEQRWEMRVLAEVYRRNTPLSDVGNEVLDLIEQSFPLADVVHFGDPAGRGRNLEGQSGFDILRAVGAQRGTELNLRFVESQLLGSIEVCQWLISHGWLVFGKDAAPMLLKALRGAYGRDDHGAPFKDGVYDHPADAWRYAVINVFRLEGVAGGGQVARPRDQWRAFVTGLQPGQRRAGAQGNLRPPIFRGQRPLAR